MRPRNHPLAAATGAEVGRASVRTIHRSTDAHGRRLLMPTGCGNQMVICQYIFFTRAPLPVLSFFALDLFITERALPIAIIVISTNISTSTIIILPATDVRIYPVMTEDFIYN